MVRQELERDPNVATDVLVAKAREIDPSVGELSARQFHARYPLQVKRSRNRGAPKKGKRGRKRAEKAAPAAASAKRTARQDAPASGRDAIRGVFLDFASDFAKAESRQEIVDVLSSVDAYVDRVQKLVGK